MLTGKSLKIIKNSLRTWLENNLNLKAFNLCAHEAGATEDDKVRFTEKLALSKEDPNSLTYTIKLNDSALDVIRKYTM